MKGVFALVLLALLSGCAGLLPTPDHPCADLYCAKWVVYGVPVRVCASTQAELAAQGRELEARGGVRQ